MDSPWSNHTPERHGSGGRFVEHVGPPSYDQSQDYLGAEGNGEHMARDVEEGTNKGRHRSIPSPAFSHATPTHSISGPGSPEFSEAGFRRSSRPLSPDFSRASTDIGDNGYSERQQPGLEVVPQPPHKPKPGSREGQAGLEVNPESNYNKEAYRPDPALGAPEAVVAGDEKRERRFCGLRKRMFILLLVVAAIIILGIALGVGLGVGLNNNNKKSSSSSSSLPTTHNVPQNVNETGGYLDPAYYSTTGAWNGTGIALSSQSFDGNEQGTIVMYFQHYTGTIRWTQLRGSDWIGGSESEIVASDAKNGTPISAVAYAQNQTSTWHIFYIDTDNHIKQKSNSNATNVWQDGPLNDLNLTVLDSPLVGMQACWYGSFYGDTDYKGLRPTVTDNGSNSTKFAADVGMHLWYASNETTFQQYGWRDGQDTWERQEQWNNKNGHAGVACYSWGPGTSTYAMFVNLENTVEIWWKDTNTSVKSTAKHPINKWTNTSVAINDVYPTTSLGLTTFLYAQHPDGTFRGYNYTWNAENTKLVPEDTFTVSVNAQNDGRGTLGSHLSVSAINNPSGGESAIVFYQTDGNDITEFTRDLFQGAWTYQPVPLDNDKS